MEKKQKKERTISQHTHTHANTWKSSLDKLGTALVLERAEARFVVDAQCFLHLLAQGSINARNIVNVHSVLAAILRVRERERGKEWRFSGMDFAQNISNTQTHHTHITHTYKQTSGQLIKVPSSRREEIHFTKQSLQNWWLHTLLRLS